MFITMETGASGGGDTLILEKAQNVSISTTGYTFDKDYKMLDLVISSSYEVGSNYLRYNNATLANTSNVTYGNITGGVSTYSVWLSITDIKQGDVIKSSGGTWTGVGIFYN